MELNEDFFEVESPRPQRRYGDITSAVRSMLEWMPATFRLKQIVATVKLQCPDAQSAAISTIMKRLIGDKVNRIEVGSGKRGSLYQRI